MGATKIRATKHAVKAQVREPLTKPNDGLLPSLIPSESEKEAARLNSIINANPTAREVVHSGFDLLGKLPFGKEFNEVLGVVGEVIEFAEYAVGVNSHPGKASASLGVYHLVISGADLSSDPEKAEAASNLFATPQGQVGIQIASAREVCEKLASSFVSVIDDTAAVNNLLNGLMEGENPLRAALYKPLLEFYVGVRVGEDSVSDLNREEKAQQLASRGMDAYANQVVPGLGKGNSWTEMLLKKQTRFDQIQENLSEADPSHKPVGRRELKEKIAKSVGDKPSNIKIHTRKDSAARVLRLLDAMGDQVRRETTTTSVDSLRAMRDPFLLAIQGVRTSAATHTIREKIDRNREEKTREGERQAAKSRTDEILFDAWQMHLRNGKPVHLIVDTLLAQAA